jgi:hypothetical protein
MGDERFEGGYGLLVDIDSSKVNSKSVRINISMPEALVKHIDTVAKKTVFKLFSILSKNCRDGPTLILNNYVCSPTKAGLFYVSLNFKMVFLSHHFDFYTPIISDH